MVEATDKPAVVVDPDDEDDEVAGGDSAASKKQAKKKRQKEAKKKAEAEAAAAAAGAPAATSSDKEQGTSSADSAAKDGEGEAAADGAAGEEEVSLPSKQAELLRLLHQNSSSRSSDKSKVHKFWDTQPVPRLGQQTEENDCIEPNKPSAELRQEPYNMPPGFEWSTLDVQSTDQLEEMYTLLNENYVEDDDNMFRFDYSIPFLQWALTPPNYRPDFHLGVRNQRNGKLVALITGIPAEMMVYGKPVGVVEINFLCVHKKLRSKRLAPVLIKEITRLVNLSGVFQAVYTAGVVLPKPVSSCRYYHRSLDPKKLIEIGFSRLMPRMTMARTIKLYKLPDKPQLAGIRAMRKEDVTSAHKLLSEYLGRFKLAPNVTPSELAHWLLPQPGVVDSFVRCDPKTNEVTDMCSFYHLPSTVIGNDKHRSLFAAYSFYNVATSCTLLELMRDALVLARICNMDVFNALNIMENDQFLKELKFGIGDGHLQYYLYNWRCPEMKPDEVGLVLL